MPRPPDHDIGEAAVPGATRWADGAFLVALVVGSALPYVAGLGFYSDDWSFFTGYAQARSPALVDLFRSMFASQMAVRPGQAAYLSLLRWAFGDHALPYHVVNTAVLATTAALLYAVLRRLAQPRLLALAAAATYGLLPHYATDRFWYAAFQTGLSMLLYLASAYADLRAVSGRVIPWRLLSVVALVASVLCYEVAMPLFVLNAGVSAWLAYRRWAGHARWQRGVLPQCANLAALAALGVYKARVTSRIDVPAGWAAHFAALLRTLVDPHYGWPVDYGVNVRAALAVNYWVLGAGLPVTAWRAATRYPNAPAMLAAAAVAILTFAYLARVEAVADQRRRSGAYVAAGLFVFALGYAIFLTNGAVQFTPSGMANRTAIAAALGVALSGVGAIGWAAALLPRRVRHLALCAGAALVCGAGSLVTSTLAAFWVAAYQEERTVIEAIQRDVPATDGSTVLLLDGVCPFVGPAVVFESTWDLAGVLGMRNGLWPRQAGIITGHFVVADRGLSIAIYPGILPAVVYPYGASTVVYDWRARRLEPLPDAAAARRYFGSRDAGHRARCPPAYPGHGVTVL